MAGRQPINVHATTEPQEHAAKYTRAVLRRRGQIGNRREATTAVVAIIIIIQCRGMAGGGASGGKGSSNDCF